MKYSDLTWVKPVTLHHFDMGIKLREGAINQPDSYERPESAVLGICQVFFLLNNCFFKKLQRSMFVRGKKGY